jgi:hypothetical protein
VATHLGIDGFWASKGWIDHYKKRHNLVYKTMLGESATVNPETVTDWKSEELPKIVDGYQPKDIFLMLMKLDSSIISSPYKGDSCHGGTKSKQRVTVLLGFNADGTEKLPPLVTGKYNKPDCFRKVKNSPPNICQIPIHG